MTARAERKRVNLALQGGGAHGAFTWGALDRLLEEDAVDIEGISGTSAGAMNAAALKSGMVAGGRAGARQSLDQFWLSIDGVDAALPPLMLDWLKAVSPSPALTARALEASPIGLAAEAFTRLVSPYQFNPANFHPMRAAVTRLLDFSCVQAQEWPKLFISATNVRSGKVKVFHDAEVTPDAILASACLPTLFQAIEIPDPRTGVVEAYWDGGYMGNPPLYPLFYGTTTPDVIIVHINPMRREEVPRTSTEILNRVNEISFNSSLVSELRAVEFVHRLIRDGRIEQGSMMDVRVHSVQDDALMRQLGVASKLTPSRGFLLQLKDAGRAAMDRFLRENWDKIGAESSVDVRAAIS